MPEINDAGQQVGDVIPGWTPRPVPERIELTGRYVRLVPLSSAHYSELYAATCGPGAETRWTYLGDEMPRDLPGLWMLLATRLQELPTTYAIVPEGGAPSGTASLCNIAPASGSVEIGHVLLGDGLQRTRAATEAFHLLQSYVFDELGYRRLEWKCHSLNESSRRAAQRLGFSYEGRFRNHQVVKGRNRDTDWLSIIDTEWPQIRAAHEAWLDPANFDRHGVQRSRLSSIGVTPN